MYRIKNLYDNTLAAITVWRLKASGLLSCLRTVLTATRRRTTPAISLTARPVAPRLSWTSCALWNWTTTSAKPTSFGLSLTWRTLRLLRPLRLLRFVTVRLRLCRRSLMSFGAARFPASPFMALSRFLLAPTITMGAGAGAMAATSKVV